MMSIELAEAQILAEQLKTVIIGKKVINYQLKDYDKMQKIGFINKNLNDFEKLIDRTISNIIARGNVIRIQMTDQVNLILGPEYGGIIQFYEGNKKHSAKFHLLLTFLDQTSLTIRLISMGGIFVSLDNDLDSIYLYHRDFSDKLSPVDPNFSIEDFMNRFSHLNRNLKSVLVGKDAIIVGISNSAFQDILFRAKLHPKRKALSLTLQESEALYNAIRDLINERMRLGGKMDFIDLFGKKGRYEPVMGPNKKDTSCKCCKKPIEKISFGGGQIYLCLECQKEIG